MAGSASLYLEQSVLGHSLAFAPMTAPAGVYLALCLATPPPTRESAGSEVAGGAYARQLAAFALATLPNNVAANVGTIEFPAASAAWGTIGYFEIWDAAAAGNRLYWGPLVDPVDGITPFMRAVLADDIVRFTAGVIQVQAV